MEIRKKVFKEAVFYTRRNKLENSLDTNFNEIINMIETRRNNAYRKVNDELIGLYWDFGKYISEKVNDSNWGDKIVDKLVEFMKR